MINLYFYSKNLLNKNKNASGSAVMRSNQIYNNIKKRFRLINCYITMDYLNIKDSAIIFVKDNFDLTLDILKTVKQNNNTIIFDVLDLYDAEKNDLPDLIKTGYMEYIDILIVNNYFMRKKYYKLNKPIYIIPHHYDVRLSKYPNPPKCEKLQFIFNGELGTYKNNCLYINQLKDKHNIIVCPNFIEFIQKYNKKNYCYLSIRKENSYEYNYRPLMKLAHAAGTDSNIIITKDKSVIDFIDSDYPYLLKDSKLETVEKMIQYVKETFNTDIWWKGRSMMNELKSRLDINTIVGYDYMKIVNYLEKPIKLNVKYKICFCTAYFGNPEYFELSNNFTRIPEYDYFCFTDIKKSYLGEQIWDIIEINKDKFKELDNCNVKISRYFKFVVWKYLKEIMNKDYDFIFYCDHYLSPSPDVNWLKICDKLHKSELGFLQYEHKRYYSGIKKDLEMIVINKTETQETADLTTKYFKKMNKNISLDTPQYFENTVLGYQCSLKKVKKFTQLFWHHYSKKFPSFRDQPLWNYLYLFKDIYPYVDNNFRKYFNGEKLIYRDMTNY